MPNKGVLVLGGNQAGLRAALDLAQSGIPVYWVEGAPFLGQKEREQAPHQLTAEMLEAAKHPDITVLTGARVTGLTGQRGDFRVEIQYGPRYVDPARCTACRDCEPVCPVTILVNGRPRKAIFGPSSGLDAPSTIQAPDGAHPTPAGYRAVPNVFIIEKRGMAPCRAACPGDIHVQGYVALIAQGRFQEALELIYEAVPFPRVLGRVCHHPCEEKCRRGTEVDEPVAICALKRFVADRGWEEDLARSQSAPTAPSLSLPSRRVAIVGAGPAGLTAAFFLARQGIPSEVFEALPVAGGMMAVGIPGYRLPPEVLQQEIAAIEALGVTIHLNHPVDQAALQQLREEYDAVFIAVGTHRGQALGIPGEDLQGVFSSVAFLRTVNLAAMGVGAASPPRLGEKVMVVGGGDVAIDSARVARRMGGKEVTVLYRRTRAEMPAEPWQIQEAEEEGIHFHYLTAPVRALGRDGVLTALECIRMELGEPDASGRRRPVPVAGSQFILECDTLLVAIGQTVEAPFEGLSLTQGGTYVADPVTLQTDVRGVFAGGDAVSGPASVIEAIAAGRRAAESILRYLRGEDLAAGRAPKRPDLADIVYYTPEQPVQRPRTQMPRLPLAQRSGFAEVNLGFTLEQAVAEAERCLSCGVCSECLACVAACQPGAIDHNAVGERLTLDLGAVIVADPAQHDREERREGVYIVEAGDILGASIAAARAMADLARFRQRGSVPGELVWPTTLPRVGVFICRCGDQIGRGVDVEALVDSAGELPGVVYARDLSFACQMGAAEIIRQAVVSHRLNRVVLAACSCCSLDQACYSCTTQRIRCKTNLGVLATDSARWREVYGDVSPWFEFVNIREHCAWLHTDEPATATAEARRLVAAAVANANLSPLVTRPVIQLGSRVLVAGDGPAGEVCADALKAQGFAVIHSEEIPASVAGSPGRFMATWGGDGHQRQVEADAVVLAPSEVEQLSELRNTVGITGSTNLAARLTGVFFCPPDSPTEVGAAVAARVAALLGRGQMVAGWNVAQVDPQRCRACGTCVRICEFRAPRLVADRASPPLPSSTSPLVSRIDAALCRGCGTCVAHCPSGAITVGYSTEEQLEAMLAALLA